jgi:hypothetical protein
MVEQELMLLGMFGFCVFWLHGRTGTYIAWQVWFLCVLCTSKCIQWICNRELCPHVSSQNLPNGFKRNLILLYVKAVDEFNVLLYWCDTALLYMRLKSNLSGCLGNAYVTKLKCCWRSWMMHCAVWSPADLTNVAFFYIIPKLKSGHQNPQYWLVIRIPEFSGQYFIYNILFHMMNIQWRPGKDNFCPFIMWSLWI